MVQGKISTFNKFLRRQTADPNTDPTLPFDARLSRDYSRTTTSQDAHLSIGSPLTCMDISPSGNCAVIGGERILKTVKVDGTSVNEVHDLKAAFAGQTGDGDSLKINAVRWCHGELDTTIVTASANGRVAIHDLNRLGGNFEVGRIREHNRQVHKLAVNPHRGNLLLTASQDGTVRFFDIKTPPGRSELTFNSRNIFRTNNDPVRDVKWSPVHGFEFACATVGGTVQLWDTRNPKAPKLKINAHDAACLTISWHPDGEHIVSGGLDQRCYVWDIGAAGERRQRPKWSFATPAPVSIATFRPPMWSGSAQGQRAAQVCVVYDDVTSMKTQSSTVHIWDIARPGLPFKEISTFESSPTAIQWQQPDVLWTVSREGEFKQHDIAYVPKTIEMRSLSTFDFSPAGEVLVVLEERQTRAKPPHFAVSDKPTRPSMIPSSESQSLSPAGPLSISRSDSEEEVAANFLGSKNVKKKKSKSSNKRYNTPLSTTPPSLAEMATVMKLDESIKVTGQYKPGQTLAFGQTPSAISRDSFKFMASTYLVTIARDLKGAESAGDEARPIHERLDGIMQSFAKSAAMMGQYRLAQTWKVLAYTMAMLLIRRSHYHREQRLRAWQEKKDLEAKRQQLLEKEIERREQRRMSYYDDTPTKLRSSNHSPHLEPARNPAKGRLHDDESTSGMATPIARPLKDNHSALRQIPKLEHDDDLQLPAPIHVPSPNQVARDAARRISPERHSPDRPEPGTAGNDSFSSEEGYDFYDLNALLQAPKNKRPPPPPTSHPQSLHNSFQPAHSQAINIAPQPRKAPLRLDASLEHHPHAGSHYPPRPGHMMRHDSNESFAMFSTSADSVDRDHSSFAASSAGHGQFGMPSSVSGLQSSDFESSWDSGDASRVRSIGTDDLYGTSPGQIRGGIPRSQASIPSANSAVMFTSQALAEERRNSVLGLGPGDGNGTTTEEATTDDEEDDEGATRGSIVSNATVPSYDEGSPLLLDVDYLALQSDPAYVPPSIDPHILVPRTINFELQHTCLTAGILTLLLTPYLKPGTIDPLLGPAVLATLHQRLSNLMLFTEAALLRKLCYPRYPTVFGQGMVKVTGEIGYFCEGCGKTLKKDPKLKVGARLNRCERCRGYLEGCVVCRGHDAPLLPPSAVEGGYEVDPGADREHIAGNGNPSAGRLWLTCTGCGHSGHIACLRAWHAGSDPAKGDEGTVHSEGMCPLEGCLHPCLPGKWRDEVMIEKSVMHSQDVGKLVSARLAGSVLRPEGKRQDSTKLGKRGSLALGLERRGSDAGNDIRSLKDRKSVKRDDNLVGASRAVESARESLTAGLATPLPLPSLGLGLSVGTASSVASGSTGTGVSGSFGGGAGGRSLERKKSVKIVAPGEDAAR